MSRFPGGPTAPPPQQMFVQAINAFNAGDYARAVEVCRQLEWTQPNNPDVPHLLGMALTWYGKVDDGRQYLEASLKLNPASAAAWAELGHNRAVSGDFAGAHQALDKSLELGPDRPNTLREKADLLMRDGRADEAEELLRAALDRGVRHGVVRLQHARAADRLGRPDEAEAELTAMLDDRTLHPGVRASALFELGAIADRAGRYDVAFEHVRQGNLLSSTTPWQPAQLTAYVDGFISAFSRDRIASLPRASHRTDRPVFIVGMPRSGTTLVEQIIASHPAAHGAGELSLIPSMAREYPIDRLTAPTLDKLARDFDERLRSRAPSAQRVADKNPGNYFHLGLIWMLFPGARVVHCQRDPADTCLSCYFQDFAHRHPYTRDLAHAGLAYNEYRRLVAHYRGVLDLPVLDVSYEELVTDRDRQTRRLIDFLGLPWDDRTLRPEQTRRITMTASSDQVRRAVYTSSIGRAKHYEAHLAPLRAALGM